VKEKCPTLKFIVSFDPLEAGESPGCTKKSLLAAWAKEKGVQIFSMEEVEIMGREKPHSPVPPKPEDIITINYTSGTTGSPKGVLLTHANCIAACSCAMSTNMYQTCYDVMLSYLPLAHIYARVAEGAALWGGAAIGYFHGNMLEVLDDIKTLRPTTFISVPRMFNKISNAIKAATIQQSGVKGALSRHVLSTKLENIRTTGSNKHAFYDRIWANKVKAAIGFDRCRGMVSGSAPISPDVLQTLRAVLSNDFIEGYGLTESYAVVLGQLTGDNSAGNCGPPAIAVECKLRDVPDMGYTSADKPYPRGELLVRGNTIFNSYYRSPEQNAEVFDSDGWFSTGDICSIDKLGRFAIIDRVKNLLKLAQGEYVSPEKVENQYLASLPLLGTGLVVGDSFQTYLVAIFGVDRVQFATFASEVLKRDLSHTDDAALKNACANKTVRKAVLKEMDRVAKLAKISGFERVKNIHLCLDPFTIENDLMTPT
jgi:long-chain acyl-CoA synthetase